MTRSSVKQQHVPRPALWAELPEKQGKLPCTQAQYHKFPREHTAKLTAIMMGKRAGQQDGGIDPTTVYTFDFMCINESDPKLSAQDCRPN